jgi:membrane-associated phospholipid phosphatase
VALTGHSTMFYKPYAAVPSLHVGRAFAVGFAVDASSSRRWVKVLALGWGPLVTLAVVATGNHFVFDAATGLVLTALAFGLSQGTDQVRARARARVTTPGRAAPRLLVSDHLGWPVNAAAQERPAR